MRALGDHLEIFLKGGDGAEEAVGVLSDALSSEHESLSSRAAELMIEALVEAPPESRATLLELLQSRWWPTEGLAKRAHEATLQVLWEVKEEGPELEDVALLWTNLGRVDHKTPARIVEAISHKSWAVRRAATSAAGRLVEVDEAVVARLVERLNDIDERVGYAALDSLSGVAMVAPKLAVPALRDEVRKARPERSFLALSALRAVTEEAQRQGLEVPKEEPSLEPALLTALRDSDEALRMQAAAVLGLRGESSPKIDAALREALGDAAVDVAAAAAAAILRLGSASAMTEATKRLEALLEGDQTAQEAALTAIEPLEPAALSRAKPLLEAASRDEALADAAKELLGRL